MSKSLAHPPLQAISLGYWISTALFCALMALSGVMYLTQPMMAAAFTHLGFPPFFRVELGLAKLIGVAALLAPVPRRVKEWAYAGFGITLVSAILAHSVVDGPAKAAPPAVALALFLASYLTGLRREASPNNLF